MKNNAVSYLDLCMLLKAYQSGNLLTVSTYQGQSMSAGRILFSSLSFSRQCFSVALETILELVLVDHDGLELTEVHLFRSPQG